MSVRADIDHTGTLLRLERFWYLYLVTSQERNIGLLYTIDHLNRANQIPPITVRENPIHATCCGPNLNNFELRTGCLSHPLHQMKVPIPSQVLLRDVQTQVWKQVARGPPLALLGLAKGTEDEEVSWMEGLGLIGMAQMGT